MTTMRRTLLAAGLLALSTFAAPAQAQGDYEVVLPGIRNVMTGNSSGGNDQVWFIVTGQPTGVPASCSNGTISVFYVSSGGSIDPQKALAMLLSAQMSKQPMQIQFNTVATSSDFWGWGISNCEVNRIVLGS